MIRIKCDSYYSHEGTLLVRLILAVLNMHYNSTYQTRIGFDDSIVTSILFVMRFKIRIPRSIPTCIRPMFFLNIRKEDDYYLPVMLKLAPSHGF